MSRCTRGVTPSPSGASGHRCRADHDRVPQDRCKRTLPTHHHVGRWCPTPIPVRGHLHSSVTRVPLKLPRVYGPPPPWSLSFSGYLRPSHGRTSQGLTRRPSRGRREEDRLYQRRAKIAQRHHRYDCSCHEGCDPTVVAERRGQLELLVVHEVRHQGSPLGPEGSECWLKKIREGHGSSARRAYPLYPAWSPWRTTMANPSRLKRAFAAFALMGAVSQQRTSRPRTAPSVRSRRDA